MAAERAARDAAEATRGISGVVRRDARAPEMARAREEVFRELGDIRALLSELAEDYEPPGVEAPSRF